jgi:hypothetical protein
MRMEDVVGEEYLGIRIFRFYFHCKSCAAEITMYALSTLSQLQYGNAKVQQSGSLTV